MNSDLCPCGYQRGHSGPHSWGVERLRQPEPQPPEESYWEHEMLEEPADDEMPPDLMMGGM